MESDGEPMLCLLRVLDTHAMDKRSIVRSITLLHVHQDVVVASMDTHQDKLHKHGVVTLSA